MMHMMRGMMIRDFELIYSRVLRSAEFESQSSNQEFGSVQVVWRKHF